MSSIAWVIQICAVSYWELKLGVTLYFGNQSPWSSASEKFRFMDDTDNTPPLSNLNYDFSSLFFLQGKANI